MAGVLRAVATAVLVVGPTVLAFFSGGFFDRPRLAAGVVAWVIVFLAALLVRHPEPQSSPARLAVAGLGLLALWTGLSIVWAPLSSAALDDTQRVLLFLAGFLAAVALLRRRRSARLAEPALAAGVVVVAAYGLSGRLLPGLVHLSEGRSAAGRLDQPLTYWNAAGALAALGVILCARLAGDATRPLPLRCAGAAGCVPAGAAVYLSFSRGSLLALLAGLAVLVLCARTAAQLRAAVGAVALTALAALACGPFDGVRALEGSASSRQAQGLLVLVLLVALCAAAIVVQLRWRADDSALKLPNLSRPVLAMGVVVAVCAVVAAAAAENRAERPAAATGAGNARLASLQTNRLDYWKVALNAFADHPLIGTGSGGFRTAWLRDRTISEPAEDAHSLYIETAAELGVVGLLLLGMFLVGVAWSASRAIAGDRAAAAGPAAALVALALHAGLDWDWEMPALTLVALLLAGLLCGAADRLSAPLAQ